MDDLFKYTELSYLEGKQWDDYLKGKTNIMPRKLKRSDEYPYRRKNKNIK